MRKYLFLAILLIPKLSFSQVFNHNILWLETDSTIYFQGASYSETNSQVPQFNQVFPWSNIEKEPQISLQIAESEPVSKKFLTQIDLTALSSIPKLTYQLVYEKKQPMLQVQVEPFFIEQNSGIIKKLNSFSIKVDEISSFAARKSSSKGSYVLESVLSENDWYKISVDQSGIYKLSYEDLINIGIQNPALVSIFGAGTILLPENYTLGYYDDLQEIPYYMEKGSDQLFGPGDYLLFFGKGPVSWSYNPEKEFFSHELHHYAERGYYFLTDDMGSPMQISNDTTPLEPSNQTVNSYDILAHYELEKSNLLSSGREWYGDVFEINLNAAYPFTLSNIDNTDSVKIKVTTAGRSNEASKMLVSANNTYLGSLNFNTVNLGSHTATYAIEKSETFKYNSNGNVVTVSLEYDQPNSDSKAWLNHIILNARANLTLDANQLIFRDSRSAYFGSISTFKLSNVNSQTLIWDISNPNLPVNMPFEIIGSQASFKANTDVIREFVAFDVTKSFPSPTIQGPDLGKVKNQNLHGTTPPDMLIVYPSVFEEQVNKLADHRRDNDNLNVLTVTEDMIFNEFSSGTRNVSALRNYLKMYYDRSDSESMTKYLLLFGDGSYDNRDTASYNPNLIMTYQSANSLVPTSSYVSDDFYGLLDAGEKLYDGLLDIGIGRLPVSTIDEAEALVNKIIQYDQNSTIGEWRNYICFIGDDEDGNIHMKQANSLAEDIEQYYPNYNVSKIFMDAYPQRTTPTGDLYPDATRAINDQVKRGALIVNYTGHGSPNGLAHEKVIGVNDIGSWDNEGKYPLFMTATCEFSRYDEYQSTGNDPTELTSAGEEVLLNPNGGGIALFTTTRLVYSGPNHSLNEKFYNIVFEKKEDGSCYRMGDIIAYSKNKAGAGINKRNFTLLGDPAMQLAFPQHNIITDSINHVSLGTHSDTIAALDFVTVSGHLEDMNGEEMNSFNGSIIPIVYDKLTKLETLANDGGSKLKFDLRNNILYKGNVSIKDGEFSYSFFVPKDIGYNIGSGKISYYAFNDTEDAHGSTEAITIGGFGEFEAVDTIGPKIELFMNDTLFKNGGIVDNSPTLLAQVTDDYGINTTGNGIGHDITATLNGDRINAISLNEYYQSELNSYNKGLVQYPYDDLEEGKHSIEVKVWDILNNSTTSKIDFVVVESMDLLLEKIYNYPNPFIDQTFFNIEHNKPGYEYEVSIYIYDLNGNLISILQEKSYSDGYRLNPIEWNGNSAKGASIGSGIFIYKAIVKSESGEEAVGSGRMVLKR